MESETMRELWKIKEECSERQWKMTLEERQEEAKRLIAWVEKMTGKPVVIVNKG